MFPVNLYLSYAFLLKLCILLVYLSFLNCYPKFNLVFSPSKETIIIILICQNYMPEIKN